ncbi:DUF6397 family protein [Streptomyces litchfieldiae]|uniref:DUF6397 family protein n=1 Tax=Streptomyces litchfieldiae TaxID=3075543 RepID=A0ABU2MZK6_9ACTN|nr:DUF6397 family protein [Streptomyces sp. DSM 44938]MDT0347088.1 DUF6397 family protein [Streptomyces sp. DSM 44938]
MPVQNTEAARRPDTVVTARRAARELGLAPGEFDAAVRLEQIPTVGSAVPWQRKVPRAELDRLRTGAFSSAALRERAPLVHAAGGAELLGIGPARFARLARAGCFSPVDVRLNRHRVLVWRYAAAELRAFGERSPALLAGPLPEELRRTLLRCEDRRPRRWRARRTTLLARQVADPWQRAAVSAAVLEPPALEAEVPDLGERARLQRLRPPLIAPRLVEYQWDIVGHLLTATEPEEVRWYRAGLARALRAARETGPSDS